MPSGGAARPSAPSRPQGGAGRPSLPNQPGAGRPGVSPLPANRPAVGGAGRPAGNRPPVGDVPGFANRPDLRPGGAGGAGRPNVAQRPGPGNIGNIGNRPGIDNRPGIGNRPGLDNRPGIGNRPGIDNRPIVGNRPVVGNGNRLTNINGPTNIISNRPSQLPANRPDWWGGNAPGWWRPGAAYHRGWVNGYWHGFDDGRWSNWGAWLGGAAIAGLATWGIGSALNSWGYMPYDNPYAFAEPAVAAAPAYDYSQPIDLLAAPPAEDVTQASISTFDQARSTFMGGDYAGALAQTEQALAQLPTDATIHEFRALCLFALRRYDEAAAALYAVLSAGPGWDWTTLVGLYPNADVYTQQLRTLEADVRQNPSRAQPRFVLAYHYLTMGSTDAAVAQYREILKLQPGDSLSSQLLRKLSGGATPEPAPAAAEPAAAPAGQLQGNWTAEPTRNVSIALTLKPDKTFTWTVTDRGKPHVLEGRYESDNGELLLSPTKGEALDGRVTWQRPDRFVFQLLGGGADDPGLTFHK
jgi:tetratricopeptide (TPR) repeat protein